MKCRSCNKELIPFLSLGKMPPANAYLREEEIKDERVYDLSLCFCPACFLVQLKETVPAEELFRHYLYFSSVSKSIVEHSQKTALYLKEKLGLSEKSLVIEIGSNDGVLLKCFKDIHIPALGIDPAKNIAWYANQQELKTIPEFFNAKLAEKLVKEEMQADLLYGANVFAHVPEIVDFVRGVKLILKPRGTAVFEVAYIEGLMEGKFDTIYHEHVFYYSLLALKNLFYNAGLEAYDVEMILAQGGSLRVFVSHPGMFPVSGAVKILEQEENKKGFGELETYKKMADTISGIKRTLLNLLKKIKEEGKKVAAYGIPAKGNTLLNYFGINKNYLSFLVDKSPAKQGLYTPGTHLFIHGLEKIDQEKPDYLLVLCWNIMDEVMAMEELKNFKARGGKFILPVPEVKVL